MAVQSRRILYAACWLLVMVVAAEARTVLEKPDGVGKPDHKPEKTDKPGVSQAKGHKVCGKHNLPCCTTSRRRCIGNLMCSASSTQCEKCGGVGQQCCTGTTFKDRPLRPCRGSHVCTSGVCVPGPNDDDSNLIGNNTLGNNTIGNNTVGNNTLP